MQHLVSLVSMGAPTRTIISALSERDEDAVVCKDIEVRLRRTRISVTMVGSRDDWHEYVKREVLPFVPDGLMKVTPTIVMVNVLGMRPSARYHKYVPPRPLENIDAELKTLKQRSRVAEGGVG